MLAPILTLQFGSVFGGDLGSLLASWDQMGVFTYLLPFLLIFAVVFGILSKIKVFGDNRGLNAVIALVIGLLSLQFQLVPVFFSDIFPRLGIALSIILVLLVLAGLFFDPKSKFVNYFLLAVGLIIFVVVIGQTAGDFGWYNSSWWYSNWQSIVLGVVVIGIFFAIISSVGPKRQPLPEMQGHWARNE